MIVSYVLIVVGVLLQIGGLIVAGRDVRKTRLTYAPNSLGLEDRVWNWVKSKASKLRQWFKWNILRQRNVTVYPVTGTLHLHTSAKADAYGQPAFPPIDKKLTVREQARILDTRYQQLQTIVNRIDTEQRADRNRIAETEKSIESTSSELRALTQNRIESLALSGLGNQTAGLWVTAFGVLLALVGEILQWVQQSPS